MSCGFTCHVSCTKPAKSTARHFVLTPIVSDKTATETGRDLGVGIGQVRVPAYLFDSSLAVRTSTNEIVYLASVLWAERLDNGIQRVLASNLATLLPSDLVRMSSWRTEDVAVEVYLVMDATDYPVECFRLKQSAEYYVRKYVKGGYVLRLYIREGESKCPSI